jgi:hypothetical protein
MFLDEFYARIQLLKSDLEAELNQRLFHIAKIVGFTAAYGSPEVEVLAELLTTLPVKMFLLTIPSRLAYGSTQTSM